MPPAEVVVLAGAPDAGSAELSGRAVAAALGELADQGVRIRAVPWGAGQPADGRPRAAVTSRRWPRAAGWRGPRAWRARRGSCPGQAGHGQHESYLLDLACARECSQADAVGYAGAAYAFTTSLEPALARREFFASGDAARHGPRLFSVS